VGLPGHVSDVWFRVTDLELASGRGCVVTTTDGADYLDFTSGIAVTSTGHCHPQVVAAIREQAGRFIHAQVNIYRHTLLEELGARLAGLCPGAIDTFFFANSGAEATEAAVKLAKQVTSRPHVIVFTGSFHGRTHLAMAMTTSKTAYRSGHAPLPAGIFVAPFPALIDFWGDEAEASEYCLAALRHLLHTQTAPSETAAVVIEPVLGEGGYTPAPTRYLQGLAELCQEHGILLVADEVQTGFGRTGKMFALEHHGVTPDVIVLAKGLGSGFPISAIGAPAELMAVWPPGAHGGTYGGNPIGCAAALATIDVLTEDGFLDNVVERGRQLTDGLAELAAGDPGLAEVRGLGLMVAAEFRHSLTGAPDAARTAAIQAHCLREGHVILMNAGTYSNVIRFMPPLVVSAAEIDEALSAFRSAVKATQ
jgi:4-aminobutyrate aminotransferase